jgi:hypothetical protein
LQNETDSAQRQRKNPTGNQCALRPHAIGDGTGGCLRDDSGDTSDGERDTDRLLVPPARWQIDGQKGPDSALYVGQEEY